MTEVEEEDRLNLLPDCLLLEIISRLNLSTKQVIKTTSTISKRWRHLWTQLPTLVFICGYQSYYTDLVNYFSFIDKTLTQCPTNFNLKKFRLVISYNRALTYTTNKTKSQLYSWIGHAITRNVQEVDLLIWNTVRSEEKFSYDDELFFNNSSLISMKLSNCIFNPPSTIRWDKLKCLYIKYGRLDEDSIGQILSGSPRLETLEFNYCDFDGCFTKSLFGNFGVEKLSCPADKYELLTDGDERFWNALQTTTMKLSRCVFSPRNGWGNLNSLCIWHYYKCHEDSFGTILSRIPCLETLNLTQCIVKGCCSGVRRIDLTSVGVKNLVIFGYHNVRAGNTLEIDAPNILSLTIIGEIDLNKILLLNTSSLIKADFNYYKRKFGRNQQEIEEIEEELLEGLLTNLGHVKEITLQSYCLPAFCRLMKRGFPEVHSTSHKENILNSSHSDSSIDSGDRGDSSSSHNRFYFLIIILLFSVWVAMVSNLLADLNPPPHILKLFKALPFKF